MNEENIEEGLISLDDLPSNCSSITAGIIAGKVVANSIAVTVYKEDKTPLVTTFRLFEEPVSAFTGRDSIINKIHAKFVHCSTTSENNYLQRMVVLTGLGGIGKSETARYYAKKYLDTHKNVAWIDSEDEFSLKSSFMSLASHLHIPYDKKMSTQDLKRLVGTIYQHFSDHVHTGLFIFDNAHQMRRTPDGNGFGIFDYLPKSPLDNIPLILVTSRYVTWGSAIDKIGLIPLEPLSRIESVDMFWKFFTVDDEDDVTTKPGQLESLVITLVDKLEGHPLALSLAASSIANDVLSVTSTEIERCLRVYMDSFKNLQSHWIHIQHSQAEASSYDLNLANVWSSTVDRILRTLEGQLAIKLLTITAYLHPDQIDLNFCSSILHDKPLTEDLCGHVTFDPCADPVSRGFNILQKYSMMTITRRRMWYAEGKIYCARIHRLLQKCARDSKMRLNEFGDFLKISQYIESNCGTLCERFGQHGKHLQNIVQEMGWPSPVLVKHSILLACKCMFHCDQVHQYDVLENLWQHTSSTLKPDGADQDLMFLGLLNIEISDETGTRRCRSTTSIISALIRTMVGRMENNFVQEFGIRCLRRVLCWQNTAYIDKELIEDVQSWLNLVTERSLDCPKVVLNGFEDVLRILQEIMCLKAKPPGLTLEWIIKICIDSFYRLMAKSRDTYWAIFLEILTIGFSQTDDQVVTALMNPHRLDIIVTTLMDMTASGSSIFDCISILAFEGKSGQYFLESTLLLAALEKTLQLTSQNLGKAKNNRRLYSMLVSWFSILVTSNPSCTPDYTILTTEIVAWANSLSVDLVSSIAPYRDCARHIKILDCFLNSYEKNDHGDDRLEYVVADGLRNFLNNFTEKKS